jgi:hypothetical protein
VYNKQSESGSAHLTTFTHTDYPSPDNDMNAGGAAVVCAVLVALVKIGKLQLG